ncbi:hypothetical protein F5H01DRAFT_409425 [Linnemannia elongata]|nr:hypothetical protein F5H01DRAFT_409425 [Linnemannia elongata]
MTEYPLTLFCLVEGQCPSRAFPVCIPPSKTVGELKKYIKAEQSPNFDDIAANNLTLWRATIYNNDGNMTCAVTMGSLGSKTELNNPRTPLSEIFPESQSLDDNTYIFVQRSREDHASEARSNTLFTGWQNIPASGHADRDGFLLCNSHFNADMIGFTSGVQRFYDSRRDKYGQGNNSVLMPVMEGEEYNIQGAERVWFMGLRRFNVRHSSEQVVVPVVDVELQ